MSTHSGPHMSPRAIVEQPLTAPRPNLFRQTAAIFLDAYRELNHKKLFWIVLLLSGLVVASFAAVGVDEKGLSVLWWHFDSILFNTNLMPREVFFKTMFATIGVSIWLAWGASILAIISVAGIIPDFIASGSIDLVLSRPIGRTRLFLTKYLTGLLFVGLQVSIFTTASYLVIGLRAGVWEPGLFWCIPLVLLFFSYLFSICALAGLLTRSTIAALLITMLCWLAFFGLNTTENIFMGLRLRDDMRIEQVDKELAAAHARPEPPVERIQRLESQRKEIANRRWIRNTQRALFAVKTLTPKTGETIKVLERKLITSAELDSLDKNDDRPPPDFSLDPNDVRINTKEFQRRVTDAERSRPLWWIIGTSLGFEAVILGICCWIFARRDF